MNHALAENGTYFSDMALAETVCHRRISTTFDILKTSPQSKMSKIVQGPFVLKHDNGSSLWNEHTMNLLDCSGRVGGMMENPERVGTA